jgi:hypothetical protein
MGRPRPVSFDVTDWRGGGAADDAGFGIVELDGQGGVGDVDGDGLPGVGAAQGRHRSPCPLRARQGSQDRYSAATHGQLKVATDLQRAGQRGVISQFPS